MRRLRCFFTGHCGHDIARVQRHYRQRHGRFRANEWTEHHHRQECCRCGAVETYSTIRCSGLSDCPRPDLPVYDE